LKEPYLEDYFCSTKSLFFLSKFEKKSKEQILKEKQMINLERTALGKSASPIQIFTFKKRKKIFHIFLRLSFCFKYVLLFLTWA
jgi:hypothetical protein